MKMEVCAVQDEGSGYREEVIKGESAWRRLEKGIRVCEGGEKDAKRKEQFVLRKEEEGLFYPHFVFFIVFQVTKHFMRFLEASRKDQSYK